MVDGECIVYGRDVWFMVALKCVVSGICFVQNW